MALPTSGRKRRREDAEPEADNPGSSSLIDGPRRKSSRRSPATTRVSGRTASTTAPYPSPPAHSAPTTSAPVHPPSAASAPVTQETIPRTGEPDVSPLTRGSIAPASEETSSSATAIALPGTVPYPRAELTGTGDIPVFDTNWDPNLIASWLVSPPTSLSVPTAEPSGSVATDAELERYLTTTTDDLDSFFNDGTLIPGASTHLSSLRPPTLEALPSAAHYLPPHPSSSSTSARIQPSQHSPNQLTAGAGTSISPRSAPLPNSSQLSPSSAPQFSSPAPASATEPHAGVTTPGRNVSATGSGASPLPPSSLPHTHSQPPHLMSSPPSFQTLSSPSPGNSGTDPMNPPRSAPAPQASGTPSSSTHQPPLGSPAGPSGIYLRPNTPDSSAGRPQPHRVMSLPQQVSISAAGRKFASPRMAGQKRQLSLSPMPPPPIPLGPSGSVRVPGSPSSPSAAGGSETQGEGEIPNQPIFSSGTLVGGTTSKISLMVAIAVEGLFFEGNVPKRLRLPITVISAPSRNVRTDLWPKPSFTVDPESLNGPVLWQDFFSYLERFKIPTCSLRANTRTAGGIRTFELDYLASFDKICRLLIERESFARIPFRVPGGPEGAGIALFPSIEQHGSGVSLHAAYFGRHPIPQAHDISPHFKSTRNKTKESTTTPREIQLPRALPIMSQNMNMIPPAPSPLHISSTPLYPDAASASSSAQRRQNYNIPPPSNTAFSDTGSIPSGFPAYYVGSSSQTPMANEYGGGRSLPPGPQIVPIPVSTAGASVSSSSPRPSSSAMPIRAAPYRAYTHPPPMPTRGSPYTTGVELRQNPPGHHGGRVPSGSAIRRDQHRYTPYTVYSPAPTPSSQPSASAYAAASYATLSHAGGGPYIPSTPYSATWSQSPPPYASSPSSNPIPLSLSSFAMPEYGGYYASPPALAYEDPSASSALAASPPQAGASSSNPTAFGGYIVREREGAAGGYVGTPESSNNAFSPGAVGAGYQLGSGTVASEWSSAQFPNMSLSNANANAVQTPLGLGVIGGDATVSGPSPPGASGNTITGSGTGAELQHPISSDLQQYAGAETFSSPSSFPP